VILKHVPWTGKRCLVTGGAGFLGSHLCRALADLGADVLVADREPGHGGSLFPLLNDTSRIPVHRCDLADPAAVRRVADLRPDYLFHLAALPYAPYTSRHPREAYACNVVATANMLEAASLGGASRFLLASSACVFGAAQRSPLGPDSPIWPPEHYYSETKREAEQLVHDAHRSRGVPATICRFGNIYGPGDRHLGRIVPQLCRQLIAGGCDTLVLQRSDGESVFEFLNVTDAVEGLIRAAAHESREVDTWQFSGGERARYSIRELARTMSRLYDGREREVRVNTASPERRVVKYLDGTATSAALGWEPKRRPEDGIRETLDWYRRHLQELAPHPDEMAPGADRLDPLGNYASPAPLDVQYLHAAR
jgi:nucleoside-diphosphate-sugar epimerase